MTFFTTSSMYERFRSYLVCDPLSPMLFNIVVDMLAILIARALEWIY
jgi:hypothetical protein